MIEAESFMTLAGGAVVGGGIALGGRIIFDWLKNRNGTPIAPATDDSNIPFDPNKCEDKHKEIDKWKSSVDKCLVQHKGTIQVHEKRLDKGSKDFETVKKDIAGLNTSYAVLAEKINPKRVGVKHV